MTLSWRRSIRVIRSRVRNRSRPNRSPRVSRPRRSAVGPWISARRCSSCAYQEKLMGGRKKRSAAVVVDGQPAPRRLHVTDQVLDLREGVLVQRVVHPATLFAIRNQAGILEHLQMEGQARLRRVEQVGQVADAALSPAQPLHDLETCFVRERVKQLDGAGEL